ncbi:phage holin, LLH family [Lactococcus fujiensis]|uniref:phage holin, LLH family n=1 Tax=Lactococcus fujiensis TaxID=610251 RepID=UPI0006D14C88|nr:phage holin, LLH family [Lactococcus fujiensis]
MNLDQILNLIAVITIAAPVVGSVITYVIPKTKNVKLQNAEKLALQVVKAVEQTGGQLTSKEKKDVATADLTALVKAGGAEVDRLIEAAVNTMNGEKQ